MESGIFPWVLLLYTYIPGLRETGWIFIRGNTVEQITFTWQQYNNGRMKKHGNKMFVEG